MTKISYDIDRSKDCILIDTNKWIQANEGGLTIHRMSGRAIITCITEVLDENVNRAKYGNIVNKKDLVLISKVAADVAKYRSYKLLDNGSYYDIPITQVIGTFRDGNISIETLTPINDKIIMERIDLSSSSVLVTPKDNSMVCRVLKVGNGKVQDNGDIVPLRVRAGDIVLIKDNISTEIRLNGKTYYAAEEQFVVGIFEGDLVFENLRVINNGVLMKSYIPEKIAFSSILLTPNMDYENDDYSNTYNRDLFKVCYVDEDLTYINKDDIILMNRDITCYVFFNGEKYFMTNGMTYIEGKIVEGED